MRVALAILALAAVCGAVAPAPSFTVDVSLPPRQRWAGTVRAAWARHSWNESFGPTFAYWDHALWNQVPNATVAQLAARLDSVLPDLAGEIDGIAAEFHTVLSANGATDAMLAQVAPAKLKAWNYFYELAHVKEYSVHGNGDDNAVHNMRACTGLLALPEDTTKPIVHGRNLDLLPLQLRNLTLSVTFVNSSAAAPSTPLFEGLGWLWFCGGFLTSRRQNGATMSGDWKTELIPAAKVLPKILAPGQLPLTQIFRQWQAAGYSFEEIVSTAASMDGHTPSPYYLIASGPGREGAVVTASFEGHANPQHTVIRLNDRAVAAGGDWFLVQTNYDHWLPNPPSDPRRTVAELTLRALGNRRGADSMGVWMSVGEFPVHNAGTAYTAVMTVEDAHLDGYIRQALSPFGPWYPPH